MPQKPFQGKDKRDLFMEPEEYKLLIGAAEEVKDQDAIRLFYVMGLGGLRCVEVERAVVANADHRNLCLWVETAKQIKKTENGEKKGTPLIRPVHFEKKTFEFIVAGGNDRPKSDPLFWYAGDHARRRRTRYIFHKYKDACGINPRLGPHSLRHLAGIVRTEAGAAPQEVAQFLGHRTLDMVLVYANLRGERNKTMASQAEDALLRKKGSRRGRGR